MDSENILIVGIGDIKTGSSPNVIRTTLGSCIAVCLYNEKSKTGGMLHCMLPDSTMHSQSNGVKRAKYADTGIEDLLGEIKKNFDIEKRNLRAKVFGGAKILRMVSQNIGQDNEDAVRKHLSANGIRVEAAKTGGEKGYQVDFNLETGKVTCRIFGSEAEEF